MRRFSTVRAAVLLCGISAVVAPGVAMAEEATEGTDHDVIIVTATRDARSLQDVPMAVTVATGEQLQKLKILDMKDISQLSPGLELTNFDPRKNTTSLRGMSFDPDQGTAPAVQVYYNEVPTHPQTVYSAIYDIGQIEVLRGPQGLLRGLSAPAGSITVATRRPSFDTVEGYAQVTGTSRSAYNVQGGISLPFSDTLALRVAGVADGNRVNHVRNLTRGDRSYGNTMSGRATLGWKPSADFTAYLTVQYLWSDQDAYQQVVGAGNTPFRTYSEVFGTPKIFLPPAIGGGPFAVDTATRNGPALKAGDYGGVTDGRYRVTNDSILVNLAMDYDLSDLLRLSFVGAHEYDEFITHRDQDYANAIPGYAQSSYVKVPYKVDTQELRLTTTNAEGFGGGVGVFHRKNTGDVINDVNNDLFVYNVAPSTIVKAPLGPGGAFITTTNKLPLFVHVLVPVDEEATSFNANLHYFAGPLKIEGGIRYTIFKKVQTTQLQTTGFQNSPLTEIIPANLQRSKLKPFTGGANVTYEVLPDTNAYVSYGHSYRAPTTGVSLPQGITADLIKTKPEKTDAFEVGLKGTFADRRIRYSLAGFYQKFNGYIRRFEGIYWVSATDSRGNGIFGFNYNGDAKIKGVEGSIDGRVTDNWDISLNAAYSRARYSNARLPCNDFAGTGIPNQNGTPKVTGTGNVSYCVTNGRISEVPDFSFTGNTEIRFPTGNVTPYVGAMLTYRDSFHSDLVQFDYKSRQIVNLFVGVRGPDSKWTVDLFARNLLDQRRITNTSLGTGQFNSILVKAGGGIYESGYRTVNTMAPREFGATLGIKW